jgi:hypothetical protein
MAKIVYSGSGRNIYVLYGYKLVSKKSKLVVKKP